ncbi:hypothetical protein [Billgrantia gudaonensis]|uniref:hypothetical protein n=1 Tax=Billgrantia gudaonensis TaxID=376427 RepID=UPI00115FF968|nr:hypothetical protein [Halomonas gudaonensis]
MSKYLGAIQPLFSLIVKGAFLLALAFGLIGIVLVCLDATGDAEISVFGQSIKSKSVGVSALFLAAVMTVITIRRVLGTVNTVAGVESKSEAPEGSEELLEKHKGNKVTAAKEIRKGKSKKA